MKNKIVIIFVLFALVFVDNLNANNTESDAKSEDSLQFSFNADLVSRYVWRGQLLSANPNIQPYGSISFKGFSLGAWASYGVSTSYAETDLYLSYSFGALTFTINDYYVASDDSLANFNYFNWKKSEMLHTLEGMISYIGSESFPITLTAATFFAGADDSDGDGKNDYSTYFEAAYTTTISRMPLKLFVGATPQKGFYNKEASIVNVGVSASKKLKISNTFELPIYTSLSVNPNSKDMFFVFGITF